MDNEKIKNYIRNEYESEFLDFKLETYDWKKLDKKEDFLKDVIAFANSSTVGDKYIVLGAKINKEGERVLNGINPKELEDSSVYQQIVVENIEPEVSIEVKPIDVDGLTYGIVRIFNCNNKPYLLRKKYGNLEKGFMVVRKGSRNTNISRYILDDIYASKNPTYKSDFKIVGLEDGQISDKISIKEYNFLPDLDNDKKILIELLRRINEFIIDDIIHKDKDEATNPTTTIKKAIIDAIPKYPKKISDEIKDNIIIFAKTVNIELNKNFFDIGDLTEMFAGMYAGGQIKYNISGSTLSQEKYHLILQLHERLNRFVSWYTFKDGIKDIKYIELAISEIGNTTDEEVEINIEIPKKNYVNYEKFPEVDSNIIDEIDECYSEKLFKPEYKSNISDYRKMPMSHMNTIHIPPHNPFCSTKSRIIDGIYDFIDYDISYNNEIAILSFTIKNIKENETMVFPGKILINGSIDKINYSIISKKSNVKIEGTLMINKNTHISK